MAAQASTTKKGERMWTYIPNKDRAITNAKIATVLDGKRLVKKYRSGEPLKGKIEN